MQDTTELAPPHSALRPIDILIVEDSPDDLVLLLLALRRAGYAPDHRCVRDAAEMAQALSDRHWDIVLSDYTLPGYSGLMALRQVREYDPDMPFIIVSGNIGEDVAVAAMKAGGALHIDALSGAGATIIASFPQSDRRIRETDF